MKWKAITTWRTRSILRVARRRATFLLEERAPVTIWLDTFCRREAASVLERKRISQHNLIVDNPTSGGSRHAKRQLDGCGGYASGHGE